MTIAIKADSGGTFGTIQVNGNDIMKVDSTGNYPVAGKISEATQGPSGSAFCFRNKIINGDMRISQRGTVSCPNGNMYYTADRWMVQPIGAATTIAQALTQPNTIGSSYGLTVAGAAGLTQVNYFQRIESANTQDLVGKTVVLSFYVFSPVATTVVASIARANTTDNFSGSTSEGTFTLNSSSITANVWTKVTGTLTLSASAFTGLQIAILLTGAFSAGLVYLTNVQLEAGSVATPFENRPYGVELALCQRYLPAFNFSSSCEMIGTGSWEATTYGNVSIKFPVCARIPPTGIAVSGAGDFFVNYIGVNTVTTALTLVVMGTSGAMVRATVGSAVGGAGGCFHLITKTTAGQLLFNGCEL